MSSYETLAGSYDALTEDVGYAAAGRTLSGEAAAAAARIPVKHGAGSGLRHRHHDVRCLTAAGL